MTAADDPANADAGDDGEHRWGLVLAFDSDDPEFTRGFEAGRIWQATEEARPWSGLVSAGNAEMVMRIAESRGMTFRGEYLGNDWYEVEIGDVEHDTENSDAG